MSEVVEQEFCLNDDLKDVSLENLQRLGQTLGKKKCEDLIFNRKQQNKPVVNNNFKRENKNRPRECSSKKPFGIPRETSRKQMPRDPRFDSLCGPYNPKAFKKAYKFVDTIKKKEKTTLRHLLKTENDPKTHAKIDFLLQRMENQERQQKKNEMEEVKKIEESQEKIKILSEGKRPHFLTKSEKKLNNLVEKYEQLKEGGKLQKHIKKKHKRKPGIPKF